VSWRRIQRYSDRGSDDLQAMGDHAPSGVGVVPCAPSSHPGCDAGGCGHHSVGNESAEQFLLGALRGRGGGRNLGGPVRPAAPAAGWKGGRRRGAPRRCPTACRRDIASGDDVVRSNADAGAVAAEAGVSRFHLARLFRGQLGTRLLAWRSRARIERAVTLRRADPARPWSDIAHACGFGS